LLGATLAPSNQFPIATGDRLCRRSYAMAITAFMAACLVADARELTVAVAANFSGTLQGLAPAFKKKSGHGLTIISGSTGKLYAQIRNGAPFDVYMAADTERPRRIEAAGLGVKGTRTTYAIGQLVLWSTRIDYTDDGADYLRRPDLRRLAIANPKTAPYGRAAVQVLSRLELLRPLRARFVQGENVAQAFHFIVSGNADAGFISRSLLAVSRQERSGSFWLVPGHLYDPIEQQAILLARVRDSAAARGFLAFITSDAARARIREYGYQVPPASLPK